MEGRRRREGGGVEFLGILSIAAFFMNFYELHCSCLAKKRVPLVVGPPGPKKNAKKKGVIYRSLLHYLSPGVAEYGWRVE